MCKLKPSIFALLLTLGFSTALFCACSSDDEKTKDSDNVGFELVKGVSALKNNTFSAGTATYSLVTISTCYREGQIFIVDNKVEQNTCLTRDNLVNQHYIHISLPDLQNGEFVIGSGQGDDQPKASVAYVDEKPSRMKGYPGLSGKVIVSGLSDTSKEGWQNNSNVKVELKDIAFYDYPDYEIICGSNSNDGLACTCKIGDEEPYACDYAQVLDESKLEIFKYNQSFDLIPCATLQDIPDLDPGCDAK